MEKNLKRQLNILKKVNPDKNWVSSTKIDILGKSENFLLEILKPNFSFGVLAVTSLLIGFITFNIVDYPEIEMKQNRVTPRILNIVANMRESETENFYVEVAEELFNEENPKMLAEADINNLTEKETRQLIRQITEELLDEVNSEIERVTRVLASNGNLLD